MLLLFNTLTFAFSASPSQKGQRFRLLSVEVDVAIEVHFLSAMLALVAFCMVPELFPYEAIDICSILLTAIWAFEADGNGFLLYGDVHFGLLMVFRRSFQTCFQFFVEDFQGGVAL